MKSPVEVILWYSLIHLIHQCAVVGTSITVVWLMTAGDLVLPEAFRAAMVDVDLATCPPVQALSRGAAL
jgi:hypothetical protein